MHRGLRGPCLVCSAAVRTAQHCRQNSAGLVSRQHELVGWEHSMKNELIIARHTGKPRGNAQERQQAILAEFGLEALTERFA